MRSAVGVSDVAQFRRFLSLIAARHSQILNRSDIAAPLGMSVPTIDSWLGILDLTGAVLRVPPYFENLGKPKVYLQDPGTACHLLGLHTPAQLARSPFAGPIFEGFVASEIAKAQVNAGRRIEFFFFRDYQGMEVDFVIPREDGRLWLVEAKATRTPRPEMAGVLNKLAESIGLDRARRFVVYQSGPTPPVTTALSPGVEALDLNAFTKRLNARP